MRKHKKFQLTNLIEYDNINQTNVWIVCLVRGLVFIERMRYEIFKPGGKRDDFSGKCHITGETGDTG